MAISAAGFCLVAAASPANAATCGTCTASDPVDGLSIQLKPWASQSGAWKFRTRLQDIGPTASDSRRFEQTSSLTAGNDVSAVSMTVERVYSNKRKPIELINLPSDRQRRSRMEFGYHLGSLEGEHLGLAVNGMVERRRLGFAALRGKWSNTRTIGVRADWVHAAQWRLSTSYSIDQSHNPRTGIRRSIQLAAGAPPSASEMLVAVAYSPSFLRPDALRIGLEARTDRMSWSDATAMGMRDRNERRLAMKLSMAL